MRSIKRNNKQQVELDVEEKSESPEIIASKVTSDIPSTPSSLQGIYQFEAEIGHGAQGKIFRAIRLADQKQVVIKQLNVHSIKNWKEYELFHREAEVLQSLDISGVAKFYDAIDCLEDNPPCSYIVQSLIPGQSLQQMILDGRRFTMDEAYDILIQTLRVLQKLHAHEPPVIHRDIKPSNLMLSQTEDGKFQVTVIDFGAVANPQVQGGGSTVAGTYGYMPPEQLMGKPVPASDIYALAAVGVQLFSGVSPADIPVKDFNLMFEPMMQDKPHELVSLLRQMLNPRADVRLSDIPVIIRRLESFQSGAYSAGVAIDTICSEKTEKALEAVANVFEPGNIELWNDLPDTTPRFVPHAYRKGTLDAPDFIDKKKKQVQADRFRRKLKKFGNTILLYVGLIGFLGVILFLTNKSINEFVGFIVLFGFFIILLVNTTEVKKQRAAEEAREAEAEAAAMLSNMNNDKITPKDIYDLIKNGRKTIATIVDVKYQPVPDSLVKIKKNKYGRTILIDQRPAPLFVIRYKFNPPDDIREEDIIHRYVTARLPDCDIKPGTSLPIIYRIKKGEGAIFDTVESIVYPLPVAELIFASRIADSSLGREPKALKNASEAQPLTKNDKIGKNTTEHAIENTENSNDYVQISEKLNVCVRNAINALDAAKTSEDKASYIRDFLGLIRNASHDSLYKDEVRAMFNAMHNCMKQNDPDLDEACMYVYSELCNTKFRCSVSIGGAISPELRFYLTRIREQDKAKIHEATVEYFIKICNHLYKKISLSEKEEYLLSSEIRKYVLETDSYMEKCLQSTGVYDWALDSFRLLSKNMQPTAIEIHV